MSEVAVKKYIVRLSAEERGTLEALINKGSVQNVGDEDTGDMTGRWVAG